jgi:hypothetical protein
MILVRWILAVVVVVGAAKLIAKWIERKWPGRAQPAEGPIDP